MAVKEKKLKTNLNNIHIVLVEPKEPGNIGSCCRAMKNMGIHNLRLVNPVEYLITDTFKLSYGADDLVINSSAHTSLKEAVADIEYVVGTTRRKGKFRQTSWLSEVLPDIINYSQNNKIAIVFGRESKGLSNEELELCQSQISIPTKWDFPTLNLAQSVLIVCYELFLTKTSQTKEPNKKLVTQENLEKMYNHIDSTLSILGYGKTGSKDLKHRIILAIKRIADKAEISNDDVRMAHGLCSQIETKLNQIKKV